MAIEECAKTYNVSPATIIKILDGFKIKRWSKSVLFSPDLDEHYFDAIDTPQKAYWLGLLMTDGCVYAKKEKSLRLCLTLKTEDKYLIEQFLSDLKCNKKMSIS